MKSISTLLLALVATSGLACSGNGTGSSAENADARLGMVQTALSAPTGIVSPTTARNLLAHWQSLQRVSAAFDSILFVGTATARSCLVGSEDGGAYDLSCLTGGKVTGRLTFQSRGSEADAGVLGLIDANLEDACVGDACVNASALVSVVPGDCAALATLAVAATVSRGGESLSASFGAQGGIGRGPLLPRVVYFDAEDRSFILEAAGALDSAGPYLVTGANQSVECSFLADGGQCTGAEAFAF